MPADVQIGAADLSDPARAKAAADGASVIYQALNPPYHQWADLFPALQASALAAANTVGARYVSIENLYMYDGTKPITEASAVPLITCTRKPTVGAIAMRVACGSTT